MTTTITDQDKKLNLARNIIAREQEVYHYQVNIDNYTAMLSALPVGEWPENLVKYKGYSTEKIATEVPEADISTVSDLIYRDRVSMLLKTEKIEQGKAKRVYDAMLSQIDPAEFQELIAQLNEASG